MNWSGKCEGPGGGDRRGALCTQVHTSYIVIHVIILILLFKNCVRMF
jgi:hypothetical protein